jgi:hypothetical protein
MPAKELAPCLAAYSRGAAVDAAPVRRVKWIEERESLAVSSLTRAMTVESAPDMGVQFVGDGRGGSVTCGQRGAEDLRSQRGKDLNPCTTGAARPRNGSQRDALSSTNALRTERLSWPDFRIFKLRSTPADGLPVQRLHSPALCPTQAGVYHRPCQKQEDCTCGRRETERPATQTLVSRTACGYDHWSADAALETLCSIWAS